MKLTKHWDKEYRILALAVAFFLVGFFFFLRDGATPGNSNQTKAPVVIGSVQGGALSPGFANFPAPSNFRTFTYDATGLNGNASFTISATCHDTYATILIFPAAIDYRSNVIRAVYNKAFPCDSEKTVSAVIAPSDLSRGPYGTYYFFTADQGLSGTWYNPQ